MPPPLARAKRFLAADTGKFGTLAACRVGSATDKPLPPAGMMRRAEADDPRRRVRSWPVALRPDHTAVYAFPAHIYPLSACRVPMI